MTDFCRTLRTALLSTLVLLFAGCRGDLFVPQPSDRSYTTSVASLREAANAQGILYGTSVRQADIAGDPQYAALVASQVNLIVPENELKWETTEPSPGQFNFVPGDQLLAFAQQHGLKFRGHNLVWHEALPAWVGSEAGNQFQQDFINHIQQEVSHYADQVISWDVINEGIQPGDGQPYGLRNTIFLKRLGPSYIEQAFRTAASADPNALLVYNEIGLLYDTPDGDARRDAVLNLLTRLQQDGVPIHALGIEAHLETRQSNQFNAVKFTAFVDAVSGLGLRVFISELDVADNGVQADPLATRDQIVADAYYDFLHAALAHGKIDIVGTWGLSDRYSWLSLAEPRSDGVAGRPLPFDEQYAPTAPFGAMVQTFQTARSVPSN